jgi:hypothetical protein
VVPYIEPSADPVLQSRLFSYPDTHRHRLGVNYQQLPVNAPVAPVVNFQRDGPATFISQGNRPNYQSTIQPLTYAGRKGTAEGGARDHEREAKHENFVGGAWRDLSEITERKQGFSRILDSLSVLFQLTLNNPEHCGRRSGMTLLGRPMSRMLLVTSAASRALLSKLGSVSHFSFLVRPCNVDEY